MLRVYILDDPVGLVRRKRLALLSKEIQNWQPGGPATPGGCL